MKAEQILAWLVMALIASAVYATLASAAPTPIHYRNQDRVLTGTAINVCPPFGCSPYPSTCGPLQTCTLTAELPPGNYPVYLQISENGTLWSADSNSLPFAVPSTRACDFDYDRSGSVTVRDFGTFLRWYAGGYVTTADFGRFMSVFGKRC